MKGSRLGLVSIIAIAFVLAWSWGALNAAQMEEKEGYKKEVQEKLKILDKKTDEMKRKASELKGEAKEEWDRQMTELHKVRATTEKKWTELKSASAEEWDKVKADMDAAVQAVKNAYDKAAAKLTKPKG
jgi:hypothetical protein